MVRVSGFDASEVCSALWHPHASCPINMNQELFCNDAEIALNRLNPIISSLATASSLLSTAPISQSIKPTSSAPAPRPPPTHSSSSCITVALNGPFLTIMLMTSNRTSAAAIVVCSAFVSYAGATSTISAATKLIPSRPRRMVRSSRVDQPPVSGVPVAGATLWGVSCCWERIRRGGEERRGGKRRRTGRIQRVNIDTQVHRLLRADSVPDLLDNPHHADGVDFPRFGDLKPTVAVVFVVARTGKCGADAGVDVGVVGEETLFVSMIEVGAVVDGS